MVQDDESSYDETQNPRKIATENAKQIVHRAMLLRKGAINVAREAYDRKGRIVPSN
jgi:glutamate dehydrogenase (NAD(P)+)